MNTPRNIMKVYGHGNEHLGDFWEDASKWLEKGVEVGGKVLETGTKIYEAGKKLIGPTTKAQQQTITGGQPVSYAAGMITGAATASWLPMAIGAGVLGLAAILFLKR